MLRSKVGNDPEVVAGDEIKDPVIEKEETKVNLGRVKWFRKEQGYGFIVDEADEEMYFVHFASVEKEFRYCLEEGFLVQFDIVDGDRGKYAVNVSPAAYK